MTNPRSALRLVSDRSDTALHNGQCHVETESVKAKGSALVDDSLLKGASRQEFGHQNVATPGPCGSGFDVALTHQSLSRSAQWLP